MTATEKDRDILAHTLWGEARGEGLDGQIAVAWTIRNRVFDGKDKSWWGGGLCRGLSQVLAVQLLESERPELCIPEWRQGDPGRAVCPGPARLTK